MRLNTLLVPVAALAMAVGSYSAEAGQRGNRPSGGDGPRRDQSAGNGQRAARPPAGSGPRADGGGGQRADRSAGNGQRAERRNPAVENGGGARVTAPSAERRSQIIPSPVPPIQASPRSPTGVGRDDYRGGFSERRGNDRVRPLDRHDAYRYSAPRAYAAPRVHPYRPAPPHYYGPASGHSLYFAWGSGYRYGSPYYGRVYGYLEPAPVYGAVSYYGDVRLLVRPREAAVYVDGYYAGIVDNFDGVFQRLTLAVGPHRIEIAAPGLESRVFDVYVDPTHTVDLRGDLLPARPY